MKDEVEESALDQPKAPGKAAELSRLLRSEFLIVVIAMLAAAVVFSIPFLHEHIAKVRAATEYAYQHRSAMALAEGLRLAAAGEDREAFELLKKALETALTPRTRQDALLALGDFLLDCARKSPAEYALAARQYFRIALPNEMRPDRRIHILTGLLAVAHLRDDLADLRMVGEEIHQEKMADEDRVAFLCAQLDAMHGQGTWRDMNTVLKELLPYEADPRFSAEVKLQWATAHEQILAQKDYFAAWRKSFTVAGETASDEELRSGLFTNLLVNLDELSKSPIIRLAEEAKFKAFRLTFEAGRYDEAGLRLENLHLKELGPDERAAALITAKLARHENHLRVFQERVLRYVEAYEIDAEIEPFFYETLNLRIASGKGSEVLNLLDRKLTQTTDVVQRARLLLYMGELARKLNSYAVAERCYEDVLNMPEAVAFHPRAMLARCSICAGRGDLTEASQWLGRCLSQYPHENGWRDAAGQLVAKLRDKPEKGGADLAFIALLLSNRLPNDAITTAFLSLVAQQMETLGMSSLAHNYYNRILLQPEPLPSSSGLGRPVEPPSNVMLGNARCLLDLNRKMEADRILRTVCSATQPNETRSEAALLWAGMALDRDQKRESERRLSLVDIRHSNTNVAWQANVNRLLLRMSTATNATEAVLEVLGIMHDTSALEHPELVHKVYQTCLEVLAARNDVAGLHQVFGSTNAVMSDMALDEFRLRIAKQYLARQDYAAAGEWLQKSSLSVSNAVSVISKHSQMVGRSR